MPPAPQPILLEVLAYVPTDLTHCASCEQLLDAAGVSVVAHREMQAAYPPEIVEQAERLTTWLQGLAVQYGDRLHIRVVDPQSMEVFFKALRHWIRRYPAFVINRRRKHAGWDSAAVERLLADEISGSGGT
jgi:hypothetical protein